MFQRRGANPVTAVDDVSLNLEGGECLAVVGESGSGKSTLARIIGALIEPTDGNVLYHGVDPFSLSGSRLRVLRRDFQFVFQNPRASLNRRRKVSQILAGALKRSGDIASADRLVHMVERVGLTPDVLDKYPHQMSGGQAQRVSIARALAPNPDLLILDEPVSALDLSVQAQILNLLKDLKSELGLGYLFISHDLAVVRFLADRIVVMKEGRIIEAADRDDLFANPLHDYTRQLLALPGFPWVCWCVTADVLA